MSQKLEHITTSTKAEAQHAARQIRDDGYSNVRVSRKPGTGRGKNAWWRVTSSGPKRSGYAVAGSNARRKNPTKAQKREKTRKASVQRRVATALAKFLRTNPAIPAGLRNARAVGMRKNKGGSVTIVPIKIKGTR